jgi:uncharacterized lipoprotein NlpE involved in copper resistance
MKKILKISAMAALAVSTLGLVGCSNDDDITGVSSVTFLGVYPASGDNTGSSNGFTWTVNTASTSVRMECPSGYYFPTALLSNIPADQATVTLTNTSGKTVSGFVADFDTALTASTIAGPVDIAANQAIPLVNNDGGLGVMENIVCVKGAGIDSFTA